MGAATHFRRDQHLRHNWRHSYNLPSCQERVTFSMNQAIENKPRCSYQTTQSEYSTACNCITSVLRHTRDDPLSCSPADGGLAVGRPLSGAQGLSHLSLSEAQGEAADLELFRKLPDLVQVHPVHYCTLSCRADSVCKWAMCCR